MAVIHYFWFYVKALTWFQATGLGIFDIIHKLVLHNREIMKNILIWTAPVYDPIVYLGTGQESFLQKNCSVNNCYITKNYMLYNNVSDFDMIIFHGPQFLGHNANVPISRSPHQIYVFASMEAPVRFPTCNEQLNGFFNWTWTYRIKSDITFDYMIIKDKKGNVIGPKQNMHWEKVENMKPINETLKSKLDSKNKAAAWFVSNCNARNNRRQVASEIKDELEKYGFTLDVYGKCGWMSCYWNSQESCEYLVEKHYYFYLAFENSFSEDYVTEKLLRALKHYSVPVVYGGANYTRFMPDGIYLNARMIDVEDLVEKMVDMIKHKELYYNYFRWHNHYSYHEPTEFPDTDPYCNLCAAINDEERLTHATNYENFEVWWNEPNACPKYED